MASKNKNSSKATKSTAKVVPQEVNESLNPDSVVMVFNEDKYFQDYSTPHFIKGKEYVIEGGAQIARWLKRGGVVVSGEVPVPEEVELPVTEVNESVLVDVSIHEEKVNTEQTENDIVD